MTMRCGKDCWLRTYLPGDTPQTHDRTYTRLGPERTSSTAYSARLKDHQIRMLCIEPGAATEKIHVNLMTAVLIGGGAEISSETKKVEYEALSYCWGQGGKAHMIMCNGKPFGVTQGAHSALKHLKLLRKPRYVWIDAICINQDDIAEKSVQVQKMFEIYASATQVIAWLGEEAECGSAAMSYLQTWSSLDHDDECMKGLGHVYQGLGILSENPYFRRTWIRQEVFAAKHVILQVGDQYMGWDPMRTRIEQILWWGTEFKGARGPVPSGLDIHGLKRLNRLLTLLRRAEPLARALLATGVNKDLLQEDTSLTLDRVLRGSSHFKATEPKDFIYGVLGMTVVLTTTTQRASNNEEESPSPSLQQVAPGYLAPGYPAEKRPSLQVDYSRSTEQVFADVTEYVMRVHKSLDVIFFAYETQKGSGQLPSWVPDWKTLPQITNVDNVFTLLDNNLSRTTKFSLSCDSNSALMAYQQHLHRRPQLSVIHSGTRIKLNCQGSVLGHLVLSSVHNIRRPRQVNVVGDRRNVLPHYESDEKCFEKYQTHKEMGFKADVETPCNHSPPLGHTHVSSVVWSLTVGKCFAPNNAKEGDMVVLLEGASLPAILRPTRDRGGEYSLVGPLLNGLYVACGRARRSLAVRQFDKDGRPKDLNYFMRDVPLVSPLFDLDRQDFVLV